MILLTFQRQPVGEITKEIFTLFTFPAVIWVSRLCYTETYYILTSCRLVVFMVLMCLGILLSSVLWQTSFMMSLIILLLLIWVILDLELLLEQLLGMSPSYFIQIQESKLKLYRVLISGPMSDWLATYLARKNNGIREAEHRLPIFFLGFIFMPGALLLFGLCATYVSCHIC